MEIKLQTHYNLGGGWRKTISGSLSRLVFYVRYIGCRTSIPNLYRTYTFSIKTFEGNGRYLFCELRENI